MSPTRLYAFAKSASIQP